MLKSEINTWGCVCVGGRVKLSNARPEDLLWSAPLHNCARTSGKNSSIVVIVDTGVPAPSSQGWKGILWAFTPNVWGGILLFFFFFRAPIVTTLATGKTTRGLGWFFCVQLSEDFVAINLSRARWTYRKRNQVWTSTSRSYFCRSDMYVCVTGSVDRSVTLMISCEVPCGGHSTSPAQPHMTVTSNMLNLSQMCMFKMT